jgi:hypothetical protein
VDFDCAKLPVPLQAFEGGPAEGISFFSSSFFGAGA